MNATNTFHEDQHESVLRSNDATQTETHWEQKLLDPPETKKIKTNHK